MLSGFTSDVVSGGREFSAVLLDLDGTLVDTAPDLLASLNRLRAERGLHDFPEDQLRPAVAHGGLGMLRAGFSPDEHPQPDQLLDEFLDGYARATFEHSRLFPGMAELLQTLEAASIPWGVVTNKSQRFSLPLLRDAGLAERAAVIICGDTLPVSKPDPAPVRLACDLLGLEASRVVMVGDDAKDMQAAIAAGCQALWAGWGYGGERPGTSGCTVLGHPSELLASSSRS